MNAYYRLSEAQEHDIFLVSSSLNAICDIASAGTSMTTITLNAEEVTALLTILRERLPDSKTMPFVVE